MISVFDHPDQRRADAAIRLPIRLGGRPPWRRVLDGVALTGLIAAAAAAVVFIATGRLDGWQP